MVIKGDHSYRPGADYEYILVDDPSITSDKILLQNKFRPVTERPVNFGYTDRTLWLKFDIYWQIKEVRTYFLEIDYPLLDRIEVHIYEEGQLVNYEMLGDSLPFNNRNIKDRASVFTLESSPQKNQTVLLKIRTESSMQVPVEIHGPAGFANILSDRQAGFGFYYGLMLVMIVYNLFLFLSTRYKSYLYYVLFISAFVVFQAALNGLAYQYLWPWTVWWQNNSLPALMLLTGAAGLQFVRNFLSITAKQHRLNRLFDLLIAADLVLTVPVLFIPYMPAVILAMLTVGLHVLLLVSAGVLMLRTNSRAARIFMMAWLFFLIGVAVYILKAFDILPAVFITEYAIQIGSVIEVVMLSIGLADRINRLEEEREQVQLQNLEQKLEMLESFSRFVPEEFMNILERGTVSDLKIGDSVERDITIMFSDIRDFTRLSEGMNVNENFKFLNSYLKRMDPAIRENNGFIDKFMGDAIMAIFPDSADHAVQAAIGIMKSLDDYNEHRRNMGYEPVNIGIGLHTGRAMLGTVGSKNRMETTVIGDTVNLASRLESVTKIFRTPVIISDFVYHQLSDPEKYTLREVDSVRVKGKERPVVLYEVLDYLPPEIIEKRISNQPDFQLGLAYYKAGEFGEAEACFMRCSENDPDDAVPFMYIRRCRKLAESRPANWSGVSRFR